MREEAVVVLRLDTGDLPAKSQQAAAAIQKIGTTGEISARQTAAAMRTLPAQFTDVATQLAGGQNPLLVLLQQGGQIKDSFGGIGPAIRGIGAAINPVTLGVGALAAVVGALGIAAYQGAQQDSELRKSILLTGNAAGLTAGRVNELSVQVASNSKQTVGSAREIVVGLATTGEISAKVLDSMALAVARVADVSGKDSAQVVTDFAGMASGVAKWAAEHNKAWNFISAEQYKYIKRLEDQGKAEEAMIYVNERVTDALTSQVKNLGFIESALERGKKSWSEFWQAALSIGKKDTIEDAIASVTAELDMLRKGAANQGILKPGAYFSDLFGTKPLAEQIAEAERLLAKLQESKALATAGARNISQAAAKEREEIDRLRNAPTGARGSREKPYIPGEFQVLDARDAMVAAAAYEKEQSRIDGFFNQALFAQDERDAKRLAQEQEFLDQLAEATRKAGLELIQDEQQRGEALVRLDQDIANRRAEAKGLSAGALAEARRLNAERAEYEIQKLSQRAGEGTYEDVKGALAAAFRDSNNPAKAFANALGNAIFTRVTARLADALATAAVGRDGNGGAWGSLLGMVGSVLGGGISVDTGGFSTNNTGDSLPTRGGMATGTNYVPRDMVALLHRGEQVVPARYNPYAGGGRSQPSVVQHISYTLAPGVSPAQAAAMLEENNRRLEANAARPGRRLNSAIAAGMA